MSWALTCTPSHAHELVRVLGFDVYPVLRPQPCPWPFPEPRPMRPEFCPRPENLAWVILDHARTQLKINVGRRGTNQLRLLERYLDVLVKHTTEIPPLTALVEVCPRVSLVEGLSLRWFILSCDYCISISKNPCTNMLPHATSRIRDTNLQTRESLRNIVKSLSNIEISLS